MESEVGGGGGGATQDQQQIGQHGADEGHGHHVVQIPLQRRQTQDELHDVAERRVQQPPCRDPGSSVHHTLPPAPDDGKRGCLDAAMQMSHGISEVGEVHARGRVCGCGQPGRGRGRARLIGQLLRGGRAQQAGLRGAGDSGDYALQPGIRHTGAAAGSTCAC